MDLKVFYINKIIDTFKSVDYHVENNNLIITNYDTSKKYDEIIIPLNNVFKFYIFHSN